MVVELHQLTAVLYLAATLAALLGLALPTERLERLAVVLLGAGALSHGLAFARLHTLEPPPPLTDLAPAVSLMGLMAVLSWLGLTLRGRLGGLAVLVAPLAFLAVVFAGERLEPALPSDAPTAANGSWGHLHVILASAGLGLLGVAGLAGLLFLAAEYRLKAKRPVLAGRKLPSLEALDRVNLAALAVGFPLLTLAVVTGMFWSQARVGELWPGGAHEIWSLVAWAIYAALAAARFGAGWRGREAAASAALGFVFLLVAVIGVELVA